MNPDIKKALAGAASGAFAAFVVDVNAWSKVDRDKDGNRVPFDWYLASKRWISGAVTGAAVALGLGAMNGGQ